MVSPPTPWWFPRRSRRTRWRQCQHQTGQAASGLLSLQGLQLAKERFQDLRTGDQKFAGVADSVACSLTKMSITLAASRPMATASSLQPMPQRLNRLLPDAATTDLPDDRLDHLVPLTPLLDGLTIVAASPAWPPVLAVDFRQHRVDDPTAPHWRQGWSSTRRHHRADRSGAPKFMNRVGAKRRPTHHANAVCCSFLGLAKLGHELGPLVPFQKFTQQVCPL